MLRRRSRSTAIAPSMSPHSASSLINRLVACGSPVAARSRKPSMSPLAMGWGGVVRSPVFGIGQSRLKTPVRPATTMAAASSQPAKVNPNETQAAQPSAMKASRCLNSPQVAAGPLCSGTVIHSRDQGN